MTLSRRHFLFCAPAIVAVTSIMPIRAWKPSDFAFSYADIEQPTLSLYGDSITMEDLVLARTATSMAMLQRQAMREMARSLGLHRPLRFRRPALLC